MRLLSSWQQHLATTDDTGLQVHQYATGEIAAEPAGGPSGSDRDGLSVGWRGHRAIVETPAEPWTLSLRVPGWCRSATLRNANGDPVSVPSGGPPRRRARQWQAGDALTLELDLPIRATKPDPRVDAVRGCVAIERGPLVYCVETVDLPDGVALEDVELDRSAPMAAVARPDLSPTAIGVTAAGVAHSEAEDDRAIELSAVPYFTWANRTVEAMRVWIPRAPDEAYARRLRTADRAGLVVARWTGG